MARPAVLAGHQRPIAQRKGGDISLSLSHV